MNNFTKEQLLNIIAAADEVLTALAGTNEDIHRDDDAKMCAAWDNLNDKAAPPEVVKQLAQSALAALTAEPVKVPEKVEPDYEVIKRILPTANPDEYACCVGADMWNACREEVLRLNGAGIGQ